MSEDKQVWVVDDALLSALFGDDAPQTDSKKRAASPGLSRAIKLHLDGKSAEALEELSRTLPGEDSAEIHSARGHIEFEGGRYEDAAQSYSKVVEAHQNHKTAWFNLGVCQEKLQRYSEAIESLRKALELDPGRIEANFGLGICLLRTNRFKEAAQYFDTYLQKKPEDNTALFGKAVAQQLSLRLDEAVITYNELLNKDSGFEPALVNLIGLAISRKDNAGIRKAAERVLTLNPQSEAALSALSGAAFSENDFESASKYCTELVKAAPDSFEARFNLGVAFHRMKQLDQAVRSYEQAIHLKPDSGQAHANLGCVLQEQDNLDGAAKSYERALQIAPELPGTLWNLAAIRELQGDGVEAENLYNQLVSGNPDWEEAWFRLGCLRLQRGEFQVSADAFQACLKSRPSHHGSLINAALAYWCMADLSSAQRMFEKALDSEHQSQPALRGLAGLAMEANEPARALEYCSALAEIGESTADLRYNVALLFQESGDAGQAAQLYRAALAENPGFSEALVNLGHALENLGEPDEARRCWAEAIRQKPELAAAYFDS